MIDLNRHILAVIEPAIMPTEITMDSLGEEDGLDRQSKTVGIAVPFIAINTYQFNQEDIVSFNLTLSGQVPELRISINDTKNNFSIDSFPRDGDVITFLLSSKNESTFKSIHMDFDITSVTNIPSSIDDITTYIFTAKAKIPLLDTEECRYFESDNSLKHIEEEAKYLGLGLATNIDTASDNQIRIQAYTTHSKFIEEIVSSSYISEESFQTSFIDQYYYLNFIDINKIFNSKNIKLSDMEDTVYSLNESYSESKNQSEDNDNIKGKLLLTNYFELRGSNNFIEDWSLDNNSSGIVAAHGHFRDIQIYDNNSESKLQEFRLDPLTSNNMLDNEEPLRGRRDENRYESQVKHKYSGRQDVGEDGLGNVHQNHVYSKIHNFRNKLEVSKMTLKISLGSFNPALYKYQKIPVVLYHYDSIKVKSELDKINKGKTMGFNDKPFDQVENENPKMILDSFMSGNYVITNIDYIFNDGKLRQHLTLSRREWPTSISII